MPNSLKIHSVIFLHTSILIPDDLAEGAFSPVSSSPVRVAPFTSEPFTLESKAMPKALASDESRPTHPQAHPLQFAVDLMFLTNKSPCL